VGGAAQSAAIRQVAGKLRLDMAAFRELAAFAQFGSDLDEATRQQLDRGLRVQEALKQGQYAPVSLSDQVIIFYAVTNGFLDDVELNKVRAFETGLVRYLRDGHPDLVQQLATGAKMDQQVQDALSQAIRDFKASAAY
jgi:F-type H+-transporting ATPase subunit alpha